MNCLELHKSLHVYLDGEYAETERHEIELHLDACPHCRRRVDRERAFLGALRQTAPNHAMPTDAAARLMQALAAEPVPAGPVAQSTSRWWRGVLAPKLLVAAALVMAAGVGLYAIGRQADDSDRIATEAIASHTRSPPMEVRGSRRQVLNYLAANVPFEVELPFEGQPEVELVGARLTRVDGRDAVLLHYSANGEPLSVVQVASRDGLDARPSLQDEPRVFSENGFDVVMTNRRGVVSSFVGSGRDGRLPALVRAAWRP